MVKYKVLQLLYADMAELADAHGSGPCESNFMEVQVLLSAPRWNGLRSIPIFLCRKISHMLRHSSSFAKGHIRVGYSVASALITPLAHYQPFACETSAQISL